MPLPHGFRTPVPAKKKPLLHRLGQTSEMSHASHCGSQNGEAIHGIQSWACIIILVIGWQAVTEKNIGQNVRWPAPAGSILSACSTAVTLQLSWTFRYSEDYLLGSLSSDFLERLEHTLIFYNISEQPAAEVGDSTIVAWTRRKEIASSRLWEDFVFHLCEGWGGPICVRKWTMQGPECLEEWKKMVLENL